MDESRFYLSASQRLKTPKQYQAVYQSKQWGGSAHFTYNVMVGQNDQPVLGVTVSKKVSKLAVSRNRIKRQIKEFFRAHQHQLLQANVVITAKPSCNKASDKERVQALNDLWEKLLRWQRWQRKQAAVDATESK